MKIVLVGILSLFMACFVATARPDNTTLTYDSSIVITRSFEEESIGNFRQDSDFQYQPPSRTEKEAGWWQQLQAWFNDYLTSFFGNEAIWGIMKFIPYLIVAVMAVVIIIMLRKATFTSLLYSEGQQSHMAFEETEENVHEINFDDEIEAAQQQGHYRKAIRLLYLKTLKQLTDSDIIAWRADKTNSDYIAELQQSSLAHDFQHITGIFEKAWYGHFDVDRSTFTKAKNAFLSFQQEIEAKV